MKKILFLVFLTLFVSQVASASNTLPSNESFYKENLNNQTTINKELTKSNVKQTDKKDYTTQKGLTNYQYDENKYHYYKIQDYIQNNLDYAQSGRLKY